MSTNGSNASADRVEWAKIVYERAQEDAFHSDTVSYEVAAIVWSANVLLLGFILEVPLTRPRQWGVLLAAIICIFLTLYVPYVRYLTKIGQSIAQKLCREIEKTPGFPEDLRLHTLIDDVYGKNKGKWAINVVTVVFIWSWLIVSLRALSIICRD
jgi:hypothetical protein